MFCYCFGQMVTDREQPDGHVGFGVFSSRTRSPVFFRYANQQINKDFRNLFDE